ncbi:MAG: hypothetical protein R3F61_29625 [Myxococcota bacterium]
MGVLVPIAARPPLADLDECAALVRLHDTGTVKLSVTTDIPEVVRTLACEGHDTSVAIRASGLAGVERIARYARSRAAGYVHAGHGAGVLRVWRDSFQVDGLDVPADFESAVHAWTGAAPRGLGAFDAYASAVPARGVDLWLAAAAGAPIMARSRVPLDSAVRIARAHPTLGMRWSVGMLEIELSPSRGFAAITWCVSPVEEAEARAITARYRACRRSS